MREEKTVLFVDDDDMLLKSLKRTLRPFQDDWTSKYHSSARDALAWLERHPCQLIVTDYMMTEMSGLDFLKRASALKSGIPRFMMTGCHDVQIAASAVNDGKVTQLFIKPFDTLALGTAISETLRKKSSSISSKISDETVIPTLIVDSSGTLIRANAQGEAFLNDGLGLRRTASDVCCPSQSNQQDEFYKTLKEASEDIDGKLRLLSLEAEHGELIFLGIRRSQLDGHEDALIIAITTPHRYGRPTVKNLQSALSLSYSEAVLAVALTNGKSLTDAGAECGLTRESARTYLKRIFEKTGTNKQTDLVRLIYSTPVAFLQKETG